MKINQIVTGGKDLEEGKTGPGLWANIHAKQERIKHGSGERMRKPGSKGAPTAKNFKDAASESANPAQQAAIAIAKKKEQGVTEGFNGEYDDEAGMAHTNLLTIARAAKGLLDTIDDHENLPEWVQEKIAKVEGMMVGAWDYLKSQEAQGVDPRVGVAEEYSPEVLAKMNKISREYHTKNPHMSRGNETVSLGSGARATRVTPMNKPAPIVKKSVDPVAKATPGFNKWISQFKEDNQDMSGGYLEETYHDDDEFFEAYGVMEYSDDVLNEAEYHGRKVTLNKPMQGDVKKFRVYVKDPKTGNIKKVNFGDKNSRIKKSNPARRKSFRARHHCENPGPKTSARYWSCRKW